MINIRILILVTLLITFNIISCTKKNETTPTYLKEESDCDKILYQLLSTSNFGKDEKYEVMVDGIGNDTIIIKAFTRNNLSYDTQVKQFTESAVGLFIIPPKKDAIYLSLNALDPIDPNFNKIKTNEKFFRDFYKCSNKKKRKQYD